MDGCNDSALFMVGVWNKDAERVEDALDVCGASHAKAAIGQWLRDLANLEEQA